MNENSFVLTSGQKVTLHTKVDEVENVYLTLHLNKTGINKMAKALAAIDGLMKGENSTIAEEDGKHFDELVEAFAKAAEVEQLAAHVPQ